MSILSEDELKLQQALGTKERHCFVGADWKDIDGLIEGFTQACINFGLYVYEDPCYEGTDSYGFIVTNEELSEDQLKEVSGYNDLMEDCAGV